MGTSINTFFSGGGIASASGWTNRLELAFSSLATELEDMGSRSWYGDHREPWSVILQPEENGEPPYLLGEGPFGFDVYVYDRVVSIGNLERFWRLYRKDSPVASTLQTIIESLVKTLSDEWVFVAVAGGLGDSDTAHDVAQNGAAFNQVCDCLKSSLGPPATSWEQLSEGENPWCRIQLV